MKLAKFLADPPGPAAAAPKLAAPGRSEGLPDETEPGFRGKISITQVGGTLSIGAFFIGKRLCIQIVYPSGIWRGDTTACMCLTTRVRCPSPHKSPNNRSTVQELHGWVGVEKFRTCRASSGIKAT